MARSSPITFTLNDAPLATTLPATQANSVQLLTPEGVNLLTGVTISGDAVSIANSGLALAGNTTYKVQLASTIGDAAGKTLAAPVSWSFTTASESWSFPGTNIYQLTGGPSPFLAIASDPAGNVFSAVTDNTLISTQMYSTTTNSWAPAATTIFNSPISGGAVGSLSLTSTTAEPVATWVGYSGNYSFQTGYQLAIYLSTFQLSAPGVGSWSTPVITPILSGSDLPTDISQVSSKNILTLAARLSNAAPDGIYIDQYDEVQQTWSGVQMFNADGVSSPYATSVATAADSNGNVTVAYISSGHLWATTKSPTTVLWPTPQQIDKLTAGGINSIALGAGVGGTTLSWAQTSGSAQPTIEVATLGSDLATWTAPMQLDDGTSPTGTTTPSIAIDNAGFIDIAYIQSNTSNTVAATDGAFLVRFNPTTSTWSSPIRMSAVGAGVNPTPAAIAVDNAGNVQLLYLLGGGIAPAIYFVSTGTVMDPGIIDNPNGAPSGTAQTPYLVIGPDNAATAVWVNTETAGAFIRADRMQ